MPLLDSDALSRLQYAVVEPVDGGVTMQSGLWTPAEVLAYLNQRQQRFIKETGISAGFARYPNALALTQDFPADWLSTIAIAFIDATGAYTPLERVDSWQLDNGFPTWPTVTAAVPSVYNETDGQTLKFRTIPRPTTQGQLEVVYNALAASLTGTGNIFTVPDEFVPGIIWGTLADMLNKLGRANDPQRAAYAESRYQQWVELAMLLVQGLS